MNEIVSQMLFSFYITFILYTHNMQHESFDKSASQEKLLLQLMSQGNFFSRFLQ